ncbi:MAG: hypothetical protein AB1604_06415 [Euryarchaeota archaeon]
MKISWRNLKIMVLLGLVMGFMILVLYLTYNFSLMWQAMSAGIIIGILLILLFLMASGLIYLFLRVLWIGRELNKCINQKELLKKKLKDREKLEEDS